MEKPTTDPGPQQPGKRDNKMSTSKRVVVIVCIVLAALVLAGGIAFAAVYFYLDSQITEGDAGQLTSDVVTTAPEMKAKVVHYLVCGIDYDADDDGRDYGEGQGMTDVILYVSLDVEKNTMNALQIPRDTYVGEQVSTGGTCKINAVYSHGEDTTNRISNLAKLLNDQFQLPVDHYVTIDMAAFKSLINVLGGVEMYVPWDIVQKDKVTGQETLVANQGVHRISGETAELILRNRNYSQADYKRLETQQYFYKALFSTFKSFPMSDVIKVMPGFITYVNTDMSVGDMLSFASVIMEMEGTDIGFVRCPGGPVTRLNTATSKPEACYGINKDNLAVLLNDHFRPYADPVPADALGLPLIPEDDFTLGQTNEDLHSIESLDTADPADGGPAG